MPLCERIEHELDLNNEMIPFVRTPSSVRRLLHCLLELDTIVYNCSVIGPIVETHKYSTILSHVEGTVERVITSNKVNGLPSVRIWAIELLTGIRELAAMRGVNVGKKSGRYRGKIFDDIRIANSEIVLHPSGQNSAELLEDEERFNAYVEVLEANDQANPINFKMAIEGILRYNIRSSDISRVHIQRARDILGTRLPRRL